MNISNFTEFLLEIGIHFTELQSNAAVEKIYNDVRKIDAFNGVKKITEEDDSNARAVISSSDSTLRLDITNEDISFVIKNAELTDSFARADLGHKKILREIMARISEIDTNMARATGIMYSTKELDLSYLKSKLVAEEFVSKIDDFDIDLKYENESINGTASLLSVKVTDRSIGIVRDMFEKQDKEDELENMVTILSAHALPDEVSEASMEAFINFAFSKDLSKSVLEKLGYGK